jgi:hypothetical protein
VEAETDVAPMAERAPDALSATPLAARVVVIQVSRSPSADAAGLGEVGGVLLAGESVDLVGPAALLRSCAVHCELSFVVFWFGQPPLGVRSLPLRVIGISLSEVFFVAGSAHAE